jgi:2-polyprenyl-3-methyl-5-hydroxy-6-metoxy-1,4-benzoquinol methylase
MAGIIRARWPMSERNRIVLAVARRFGGVGLDAGSLWLDASTRQASPVDVTDFRCPLCGAGRARFADLARRRAADGTPPARAYVRCAGCGVLVLHPLPNAGELAALYDDAYYHSADAGRGYDSYEAQRASRTRSFRAWSALAARLAPGGRVLDVGCALGFFLETALDAGLDVHGIDTSAAAVARIEPRFGPRVRCLSVEALAARGERFDVVFASDVLEHVTTPHAFVAAVARLLAPRGHLICITPNERGWLARLSGTRWVSRKIPEHVVLYGPRTVRRALGEAFEIVSIRPGFQHYPAALVARRLGELAAPLRLIALLGRLANAARRAPITMRAQRGSGAPDAHATLRVPDGNMVVVARVRPPEGV